MWYYFSEINLELKDWKFNSLEILNAKLKTVFNFREASNVEVNVVSKYIHKHGLGKKKLHFGTSFVIFSSSPHAKENKKSSLSCV